MGIKHYYRCFVKKIRTLRTRFKGDIVAEFLPPRVKSNRVIIICDGMPTVPGKKELMFYWARRGYWVIYPRYRGTWESSGSFLSRSPQWDIKDVIDGLSSGFTDLWSGERLKIRNPQVYLLAGSFGGPAALLIARDKRVRAAVVFSGVVDWRAPSADEPLPQLYDFVVKAFGCAYRLKPTSWRKLGKSSFYNPASQLKSIPGRKIMMVHAQDDRSVNYKSVASFAKAIGSSFYGLKHGGHFSLSLSLLPLWRRRIGQFYDKF